MGDVVLEVSPSVVMDARDRWDAAADALDGAWRRLHKIECSALSAEVVAAVEAFCEPWVDEIKKAAQQAQGYSDELPRTLTQLTFVDEEHAERLRSLLPWTEHDARVSPIGVGPRPQGPGARP